MGVVNDAGKIGDWTSTILTKFIRDLLNNNPPDFLPNLNAENVTSTVKLTVKDKMEYTKEARFRLIGGTGQPAFTGTWVNFAGGWQTAGFYKDPLGFVHLRGMIKSGTIATSAFTLPPGHRPAVSEKFAAATGSAVGNVTAGSVDVLSDGTVVPAVGLTGYVTLSGIRFRTT